MSITKVLLMFSKTSAFQPTNSSSDIKGKLSMKIDHRILTLIHSPPQIKSSLSSVKILYPRNPQFQHSKLIHSPPRCTVVFVRCRKDKKSYQRSYAQWRQSRAVTLWPFITHMPKPTLHAQKAIMITLLIIILNKLLYNNKVNTEIKSQFLYHS